MTQDKTEETLIHIRNAGDNTLKLNRYMLRKAWGMYYATWATAILLFETASIPLNYIPNAVLGDIGFISVFGTIGILAIFVTGRLFRKTSIVGNLYEVLEHESTARRKAGVSKFILIFLLVLGLVLISISTDFVFISFVAIFLILFILDIFVFIQLNKAFSHRIPWEGKMAVWIYLFSDFAGSAFTIITGNEQWWVLFWIPTIILWYAASFFSLWYSKKERESMVPQDGD